MKSHSPALERSIGFGLQGAVSRRSVADPSPAPALTRRVRASQPSIPALPAAVSGSFTTFEPGWAKLRLRDLVSAVRRGWSKVDDRPCTGTVRAPPRLTVTFALRDPWERIAAWPSLRILTAGLAASAGDAASPKATVTSSARDQFAPGIQAVGRRQRVRHRGQRRRNFWPPAPQRRQWTFAGTIPGTGQSLTRPGAAR